MQKYEKALLARFTDLCRHQDTFDVWDTIIDYVLFPYSENYQIDDIEKIICRLHHNDRLDLLEECRRIILNCQEEHPYKDLLGLFHSKHCANKKEGQYFTPVDLSMLLAGLVTSNDCEFGKKVLDPACGSGTLLLAAGRQNPHFLLMGSDRSHLCCKMALCNLLIHGLVGEIAHLDALTNRFCQVYYIGCRENNTGDMELFYIHSFDSNKSLIHLKTKEEWKQIRPQQ